MSSEKLLLLILYVEAWGQPAEHTVYGTEKNISFCGIEVHYGFYAYNPLASLKAGNRYDCIVACSHYETCETSNFVTNSKWCFLHDSKPKSMKQVASKSLIQSILSILNCGKDTPPSIKQAAGKPADMCGMPHFPPGDALSVENQRFRRILGGYFSLPYAYPWAGVVIRNNFRICSLFLVTRNQNDRYTSWGISAAHCFRDDKYPIKNFGFLFGVYDLRLALPYTVYRRASFIFKHPKVYGILNDIAVIKFSKKIAFNFFVRPICLPESSNIKISTVKDCMFCGWGSTRSDDQGACANQLKCIDSPKIQNTVRWSSWTLDWKSCLISNWKSAERKGPFHGDSGSALFCVEDGRYIAHGIVSKGRTMSGKSQALSTKISHYLPWILDVMDGRHEATAG